MAELKFSGKIVKIYPIQVVNEKLKKRQIVIEDATKPQYPQFGCFVFINDRCDVVESTHVGDTVTVDFNVTGRKWAKPGEDEKYFTELQAWKLIIDAKAPVATNVVAVDDDLPF